MAVDAAVPIEAAVEGRVELFGAQYIRRADQDVGWFVGVFAMQPIDSQLGKFGGLGILDASYRVLCIDGNDSWCCNEHASDARCDQTDHFTNHEKASFLSQPLPPYLPAHTNRAAALRADVLKGLDCSEVFGRLRLELF